MLLPLPKLLCVMGDPLHHTGEHIYGVDLEVFAVPIVDEGDLLAILEALLEVSFAAWWWATMPALLCAALATRSSGQR